MSIYKLACLFATGVSQQVPDPSPRSSSPLACEDVSRVYSGSKAGIFGRGSSRPTVTALQDISVSINPGELTVVAGASGSGKSTLLHLLAALDTPSEGRVLVNGTDTTQLSEGERASLRLSTVGIVFQRFHLLSALTARGNVSIPLIEQGVKKSTRRERAGQLLESVGLGDRLTHKPGRLSGGEQQRVAIARALINDPSVLIADEPTGELDTDTGSRVLDVFADLADDRAVVIATHDQMVLDRADRIIRLRDGSVIDG